MRKRLLTSACFFDEYTLLTSELNTWKKDCLKKRLSLILADLKVIHFQISFNSFNLDFCAIINIIFLKMMIIIKFRDF